MAMQQQGPPGQQGTGGTTGTAQYGQAGQQYPQGGQQYGAGGQQVGGQQVGGQQVGGQQIGGQQGGAQQMGSQQTGGQQVGGPQMGSQQASGPQMGGQQVSGQQMGGQQVSGQQIGLTLDDVLTGEMRLALEDFTETVQVCEWCADQCIAEADPMMIECIRLCRDVADLARLNLALLARDSIFGPDIAETFAMAAEACADECAQHQHAHCQECARICRQAAKSTREMLATLGSPGQTTF